MKEFTSAVEDIVAEDEYATAVEARKVEIQRLIDESKEARENYIAAEVEKGSTKKAATGSAPKILTREEVEAQVPNVEAEEKPIEFMLDGRVMHAYPPTDGQLALMLASLGRGQTADGRFSSIVNTMLECLDENDKDYFESRLASRKRDKRLGVKMIEEVFAYLTEEWFR